MIALNSPSNPAVEVVQTSVVNTEECTAEKKDFCLNGGTCFFHRNTDYLMCASNYSGQRCEKLILGTYTKTHQSVVLIVVPVTAVLIAAFILLISFYR
uniref:EGF-like domain-containing protein n=1 Tax=Eptatretus burgeri TaxID=7764 RepID=A0A8C4QMJ1_EPTBU